MNARREPSLRGGASRRASSWRRHLGDYLRLGVEQLDPSYAEQAKRLAARERLLRSTRLMVLRAMPFLA
jgi:hypothetical protein